MRETAKASTKNKKNEKASQRVSWLCFRSKAARANVVVFLHVIVYFPNLVRRVSSHICSNLHVPFVGFVNALGTSKVSGPLSASPTTSSPKSAVLHSEALRTQECVTPKRQSATFDSCSFIFLLHICSLNCFSLLHWTPTHQQDAQTWRFGRTCTWRAIFLFVVHEVQRTGWLVCLLPFFCLECRSWDV